LPHIAHKQGRIFQNALIANGKIGERLTARIVTHHGATDSADIRFKPKTNVIRRKTTFGRVVFELNLKLKTFRQTDGRIVVIVDKIIGAACALWRQTKNPILNEIASGLVGQSVVAASRKVRNITIPSRSLSHELGGQKEATSEGKKMFFHKWRYSFVVLNVDALMMVYSNRVLKTSNLTVLCAKGTLLNRDLQKVNKLFNVS
jgi:hypothetical protein